jgi:hypothetical protein
MCPQNRPRPRSCNLRSVFKHEFTRRGEIWPLGVNWDRFYDFKNIFAEKYCKKLAFLTHNKAKLCENFDHNIGFWENANFFADNWQKSQKIVIITSTPGAGFPYFLVHDTKTGKMYQMVIKYPTCPVKYSKWP